MNFLQPLMLLALPLIAVPIVIHLINQWRYQTRPWAAMMFLLQANRMNRGFARLRQWLILALRTLAVAGLIVAVSRPLASGFWSRLGSGRADTTIVLMDRSPSMSWQGAGGETKLEAGRRQLSAALNLLGSAHWVTIDSARADAEEFDGLTALLDSAALTGNSAAAAWPQMLLQALEYLQVNQPGTTDIWICSDLQATNWNPDSGQWQLIRSGFSALPQSVRFHLLTYPQQPGENRSLRVSSARRESVSDGVAVQNQLVLSLDVSSTMTDGEQPGRSVPIQLELEGVRTELPIELSQAGGQLREYRLPLPAKLQSGWGRVSLPADVNNADNEFYFLFDQSPGRRVVLVADEPAAARPLRIAAGVSADGTSESQVELLTPGQVSSAALEDAALLIWQAAFPDAVGVALLDHYLANGGQVLFFPPAGLVLGTGGSTGSYRGVRWSGWQVPPAPVGVANWRGDQDLLAATRSGAGLPVGQLEIHAHATLESQQPLTPLATLDGGHPLLARLPTSRGGLYFCTAGTSTQQSSLAEEGVVLFVVIQRAIEQGQAALQGARMRTAAATHGAIHRQELSAEEAAAEGGASGLAPLDAPASWRQLAGPQVLSSEFDCHAGVYQVEDRIFAVNRPAEEDQYAVLTDEKLASLFEGLRMDRVDQSAGGLGGIIREIWRPLLMLMVLALLLEAVFSLPRRRGVVQTRRAAFELPG